MNLVEVKELLSEIAEKDLADGSDIEDHPCSVAIRMLDQCVSDVEALRPFVDSKGKSKRIQILCSFKYGPIA